METTTIILIIFLCAFLLFCLFIHKRTKEKRTVGTLVSLSPDEEFKIDFLKEIENKFYKSNLNFQTDENSRYNCLSLSTFFQVEVKIEKETITLFTSAEKLKLLLGKVGEEIEVTFNEVELFNFIFRSDYQLC